MQFNTICTECKEMFLFTDDLLYVRPMTPINGKIRPLCFRCSTTVGSCHAYSLKCTEIKLENKKKDWFDKLLDLSIHEDEEVSK